MELEKIPFSDKVREAIQSGAKTPQDILIWGEDYELALAVAPEDFESFKVAAAGQGVALAAIGIFEAGAPKVTVMDKAGKPLVFERTGWQHF
ncbi:MAG TPA: hypothetical protein DEA55_07430 [Rhodospirillaceae bacterium]|nr:hypothetical protein [Rhodospirillaceae bacterium]